MVEFRKLLDKVDFKSFRAVFDRSESGIIDDLDKAFNTSVFASRIFTISSSNGRATSFSLHCLFGEKIVTDLSLFSSKN